MRKGKSQNECFKKIKHAKFSEKRTFLNTYTYVCISGGKRCSFFGQFGVLCFLETPVLRFVLLPYCRRHLESLTKPGLLYFISFILFPVTALKHIWPFKHSGGKRMALQMRCWIEFFAHVSIVQNLSNPFALNVLFL